MLLRELLFRGEHKTIAATAGEPDDSAKEPDRRAESAQCREGDRSGDDCAGESNGAAPRPLDVRRPEAQHNERSHLENVGNYRAENGHIQQHRADRALLAGEMNRERCAIAEDGAGDERPSGVCRMLCVTESQPGKYPARESE